MLRVDDLLRKAAEMRASDLHVASGQSVRVRVDGELLQLAEFKFSLEETQSFLFQILNQDEIESFQQKKCLDKSHSIPELGFFRINLFMNRLGPAAVFRLIPTEIPRLEDIGVPPVIANFVDQTKGLILVTGPTGSGKSTTLAALIQAISVKHRNHIITIEDPIEFVYNTDRALINQRELGRSCNSFADALRNALREDPDVLLVGEMRDNETMSLALTAAETGHLVFATLHTRGAANSVDRIVDSFSGSQQALVRTMLADSLIAVVSQSLLKRADGKGRIAAFEILKVNHAISNLIREGKTYQIPSLMQTSRKDGMILMDTCVMDLVAKKIVTADEALGYLNDPTLLKGKTVQEPLPTENDSVQLVRPSAPLSFRVLEPNANLPPLPVKGVVSVGKIPDVPVKPADPPPIKKDLIQLEEDEASIRDLLGVMDDEQPVEEWSYKEEIRRDDTALQGEWLIEGNPQVTSSIKTQRHPMAGQAKPITATETAKSEPLPPKFPDKKKTG